MNENKKASGSLLWLPVALFLLAAALIGLSTVGGVRAALSEESEAYVGTFGMQTIDVTLMENGDAANGALLSHIAAEGNISLGTEYPENLYVQNTGDIDAYVRVEVYRYWMKDGAKVTTLSPELIDLNFAGEADGWYIDETASTAERTVMYYIAPVAAGGWSENFINGVTIDPALAGNYTRTIDDSGVITTTYEYDGVTFVVEAEVDAVQTHNAEAAVKAAWGADAAEFFAAIG